MNIERLKRWVTNEIKGGEEGDLVAADILELIAEYERLTAQRAEQAEAKLFANCTCSLDRQCAVHS